MQNLKYNTLLNNNARIINGLEYDAKKSLQKANYLQSYYNSDNKKMKESSSFKSKSIQFETMLNSPLKNSSIEELYLKSTEKDFFTFFKPSSSHSINKNFIKNMHEVSKSKGFLEFNKIIKNQDISSQVRIIPERKSFKTLAALKSIYLGKNRSSISKKN